MGTSNILRIYPEHEGYSDFELFIHYSHNSVNIQISEENDSVPQEILSIPVEDIDDVIKYLQDAKQALLDYHKDKE